MIAFRIFFIIRAGVTEGMLCAKERAPECLTRTEFFQERISVHDLDSVVKTGDIILFSTQDAGAKCIQRFTRSSWNHVAMVLRPSPSQTYCIEWGGGLIVQPLIERLHDYHDSGARMLALRQLNLAGRDRILIETKLERFVHRLLTDPSRVDNDIFPLSTVLPFAVHRSLRSSSEVVDDLSQLFCSKTVAVCYKHVGLLSKGVNANGVFPKHFGHSRDRTMDYHDASLGEEIEITFEPKALKDLSDRLLVRPLRAAVSLFSPHERYAALIQRCVRRWRAYKLLLQRKEAAALEAASTFSGFQPYKGERESRTRAFAELSRLHAELLDGMLDEAEEAGTEGAPASAAGVSVYGL